MPKIPPIRLLGGLGSGGGFFEERLEKDWDTIELPELCSACTKPFRDCQIFREIPGISQKKNRTDMDAPNFATHF